MIQSVSLVTGGAGFIGSHLAENLLELGHKVICIDNLITGRESNISHLLKKKNNFQFIKYDVTLGLQDQFISKLSKIKYIFHLASPASPKDFSSLSEEIALVNSIGTRNMLILANKLNAKMLFSSTSETYGEPKVHPQTEEYWGNVNPVGIRSCYDESKRFGEMLSILFFRKYNTDIRIIRIFNTYGPRMRPDDGRVLSNLIYQAITNQPMTIYGDGKQTRSFCYVTDMVDGLIKAINSENTRGEVLNIGNSTEYSILDIAKKIKKITNSSSKMIFLPLPDDDPTRRRPDISKAKRLLEWKPKISITEGLLKMIDYYSKDN